MKTSTLVFIALVMATLLLPATAAPAPEPRKKVIAHYLCWFENRPYRGSVRWEHWSYKLHGTPHDAGTINPDGKRDISSVFYPLIGPYDSNDPDVVEYHVLSAKVAGIDGFVVDWYQPGSITDIALQQLAALSKKYQFEFAACYEEKAAFPGYRNPTTRQEAVKLAIDDYRYLLDHYATKPGYLKIDGKPAVLMFVGYGEFCGQPAVFNYMELAEIKEALTTPDWMLVRQNLDPVYWKPARGAFEWIGKAEDHAWFLNTAKDMKAKQKVDHVMFGVNPGFDSSGVGSWGQNHPVIPRENGVYYAKQWERAIEAKADSVQIITWNDFQEGSIIEPTFEFGFQYLDLTEKNVEKYNGRPAKLSDNSLPFKIYQLRKRAWQSYGGEPDELKETHERIDKAISFLIKGKPDKAQELVNELAEEMEVTWLDRIPAQKEFGRFLPTTGKEKDLNEAYKLMRSSFNLARAKIVTVSSSDPDAPDPSKIVDETWNSRWSSQYKDGESLKIDLGKKETFSKIIIDWETAFAKAFSIEVSDDEKEWRQVFSVSDFKGGLQTINFSKTEARFIRLNLKERATSWGFSIWEIGVF